MSKKIYSNWDKLPKGHVTGEITEGCLVIEGGAFRGIYNQGVLDALLQNDIHFHTVIGVSAGAMAGSAYVAGQLGRPIRLNLRYRHDSEYVGLKAFMKCGSFLNIPFIFDEREGVEGFNIDEFKKLNNRRYIAVATDCETGKQIYFDNDNCNDIREAIVASASMPFISPIRIVEGKKCLDGGCSVNTPYQWALDHNYKKIVVIRTQKRDFRKDEKKSGISRLFYKKYPMLVRKLENKNYSYNGECDDMDRLEKEGRIFMIAPSKPVTVSRMESDVEKLGDLYWMGYHDTMATIEGLKEYLGRE